MGGDGGCGRGACRGAAAGLACGDDGGRHRGDRHGCGDRLAAARHRNLGGDGDAGLRALRLGGAGDHRCGAGAGIGAGEVGVDQLPHAGVTGAAGAAAHHHGDDLALAAAGRGQEIEARRANIARLDAVDAFDAAEKPVVVAEVHPAIGEGIGLEVAEIGRIVVLDGAAEGGEVACRGDLLVVRQAGGVAEGGAAHADGAGLAGHQLAEGLLRPGDVLGDHHGDVVGGFGDEGADRLLDGNRGARADADLGGRLAGGFRRDAQRRLQREAPCLELFEQQVERHHFGDGGRVAMGVGGFGVQGLAGLGVDDDGGIGGRIAAVAAGAGLGLGRRGDADHHGCRGHREPEDRAAPCRAAGVVDPRHYATPELTTSVREPSGDRSAISVPGAPGKTASTGFRNRRSRRTAGDATPLSAIRSRTRHCDPRNPGTVEKHGKRLRLPGS